MEVSHAFQCLQWVCVNAGYTNLHLSRFLAISNHHIIGDCQTVGCNHSATRHYYSLQKILLSCNRYMVYTHSISIYFLQWQGSTVPGGGGLDTNWTFFLLMASIACWRILFLHFLHLGKHITFVCVVSVTITLSTHPLAT